MRAIPVLLASALLGAGAIGAVVKLSPASPSVFHGDWERHRAGPDSGRVAILLDALGKTDPVICEMLGDQIGNFWSGGDENGIGRLAGGNSSVRAAKDSIGGTITDPRAIERLIVELNAQNTCVRRVASKMLGQSVITANRLTSLLNDASPTVREAAALAAGNGEHKDLRLTLEKSLADRVPAVAAMSAWALGELEDHGSVPVLVNAVHSTEPRVRLAAIWALGQLEDARAVPVVVPALRDAEPNVRAMSAEVLGKFKNQETLVPLERALSSDTDPRVRVAAASALGEISAATSLRALGGALDDADITVRRAAASALGELDDSHIAPPNLVKALSSTDPELRHLAAASLCSIADPTTTPALIGLLADPDAELRKNAIEALGNIGSPSAISGLTKALGDKDPHVRRAAAEALGEIKEK